MMHFCRKEFYKILDTPGELSQILDNAFQHSRELIKDIKNDCAEDEFVSLIFNLRANLNKGEKKSDKAPEELMYKAGYILYPECQTEEDIQKFKCYYKSGEELCTFRGGRLNSCRVWFAVKENVDEINRENFKNPKRQDEYGTSVISIQFSRREPHTLSIKNRYNHTVDNPDNTFNSDLDNIIEGLSGSFYEHYGIKDDFRYDAGGDFELTNYVYFKGKYYRYKKEINNIYYCGNNTIVDFNEGKVVNLPNHVVLVENYIFDMKEKKIYSYDTLLYDCFEESFGDIKSISYDSKSKEIIVKVENGEDVIVGIDDDGNIKSLKNNNLKICGNGFLQNCVNMESIELNNLKICDNSFLCRHKNLKKVNLPNLVECGYNFMCNNTELTDLNLPKLEKCGNGFMIRNCNIKCIKLNYNRTKGE